MFRRNFVDLASRARAGAGCCPVRTPTRSGSALSVLRSSTSDMNPQQALTQKWLRQNTASYPHRDRLCTDVDAALVRLPTLAPKTDIYTHDDGRTQLLLCVHGLLPISFRQASYNIPVAIWFTREYPSQPPIVYVVPTSDMLIRAGKFVDLSGRIDIEYIQHWKRKSEGCHLSGLLDAMQEQFSRESPVYAKPRMMSDQQHLPLTAAKPSSPPPATHSPTTTPQTQQATVAHRNDQRPSLPPKPGPAQSTTIRPVIQSELAFVKRPPMSSPSPPLHPGITQFAAQPSSSPSHYPTTITSPLQPPSANQAKALTPTQSWSTPHATHLPPHFPVPPPPPTQLPPEPSHREASVRQAPPNLLDGDPDLTPEQSHPPAPPRPANPEVVQLQNQFQEKLAAEFASFSQAMALDADRLRAQQADLLAGEPAVRDEMARLEAVKDVCLNVAGRIRISIEQAERNIAELRRKGDPEVDELVCASSIVHNQLIELVAEDSAIEDTVYQLHRALNAGRIDLERFLRTTRVLSEEQFMKRALIEKIQEGLPIGASMGPEWGYGVYPGV